MYQKQNKRGLILKTFLASINLLLIIQLRDTFIAGIL